MFGRALLIWLSHFEERIVQGLLSNRKFHDGVGYIHKSVQHAKEGKLPPRPQLMDLENAEKGSIGQFMQHFKEEIQNQIKGDNPLKRK